MPPSHHMSKCLGTIFTFIVAREGLGRVNTLNVKEFLTLFHQSPCSPLVQLQNLFKKRIPRSKCLFYFSKNNWPQKLC